MLPSDHPAVAHPDEHRHRVVAIPGEPDGVGISRADDLHSHRLLQPLQPSERIPQLPGALVVLGAARLEHCLADLAPQISRLALEELQHVVDHAAIVGTLLPPHAGRLTPPDVVVEAGTFAALLRQDVVTAPDGVEPPDDRQCAPQLPHVGVGSEVPGTGDVSAAGHQDSRKWLAQGDGDRGVTLVVLQPDVEPGPVLLDQVVLENERLRLARHHDGFHVGDEPLEYLVARTGREIGREVAAHPALETLGLPDVQHLTLRVAPEVDSGAFGQCVELALQRFGKGGVRHTPES